MLFASQYNNQHRWRVEGKSIRMQACRNFRRSAPLRMGFCRIANRTLFLAINLFFSVLPANVGYCDERQPLPRSIASAREHRQSQDDSRVELQPITVCPAESQPTSEFKPNPESGADFVSLQGVSLEIQQIETPANSGVGDSEKATGSVDAGDLAASLQPKDDDFADLITPDLGTFWKCYSSDNKSGLSDVWKVVTSESGQPPILVCSGQPKGFLFTSETYSDFELTLDWKFPTDANGNSGVLVYLQDEPRIWPTSMQIQFHQPKAGSVFPSGDAKSANTSESDLAGPFNSWNSCRIVSRSGQLSVEINGKKAGEITCAVPATGSVALQSEGAEVHFRRIRIRKLTPDSVVPGQAPVPLSLPETAPPGAQSAAGSGNKS